MASVDVTKARDSIEDVARSAREQLEGTSKDLAGRAGKASKELGHRAEVARDAVRERLDDVDLEPSIRRAKIGFWTVARAVIGALVAVPGVIVRGLGGLSEVADEAVERGTELSARSHKLSERSRQLARSVPLTRAARRRARRRTIAWAAGSFAIGAIAGAVGGYLLARRNPTFVDDAWNAASSATEHARDVAADTIERARDAANEGAGQARDVVSDAMDDAKDALDTAADQLPSGNGEAGAAAERGAGR